MQQKDVIFKQDFRDLPIESNGRSFYLYCFNSEIKIRLLVIVDISGFAKYFLREARLLLTKDLRGRINNLTLKYAAVQVRIYFRISALIIIPVCSCFLRSGR
jgi:hypothetical protein